MIFDKCKSFGWLDGVFMTLFIGLLFIGCQNSEEEEYLVFKYNQPDHITSLDPAFAKSKNNIWAVDHIFNGLVRLDDSLYIISDIAKEWTISPDGRTYSFLLRDDVFFHENVCFSKGSRKVIASDFTYSFQRLIDPEVNSPGSWLFSDKVDGPGSFYHQGDSLFVIQLNKEFLPLLGILTMQYCSVVPRECIEYYTDKFRSNPIGTGPFKFKRWEENQALFLTRNDSFFRQNSTLDGVKISFIPDKKIAFLELLNGNLDFVNGLESAFINDLLDKNGQLLPKRKETLNFVKAPYLNMEYLGINMESLEPNSPLKKKEIRQALNLAIDRNLMLASLRNRVGKAADSGFTPRGLPSFDNQSVTGYAYLPDSARALILKAGYDIDHPMPTITLFTNSDYLDLTTFIVRQWQELGIDVELQVLESAILRDGMRKGQIPFFRASWIADYPDAESFLCVFYGDNPAPPNYTRFDDEAYNNLYNISTKTTNTEERYALYRSMDKILIEEAPVIFLFYDETALFFRKNISNISDNAVNLLDLEYVKKQQ